jgi:predicted RecB family nuclease
MVNDEFIHAYLKCPYKAYLIKQPIIGQTNVYIEYYSNLRNRIKADILNRKYRKFKTISEDVAISNDNLTNNDFIINGEIKNSDFELLFDIIEIQNDIENKIIVTPISIYEKEFVSKNQKLLITIKSLKLEELFGIKINSGKILVGQQSKQFKFKLNNYKKEAFIILQNVQKIVDSKLVPEFRRNKHCQICEYDMICKKIALEKDDLSLLSGISPKEIKNWNSKGIFTINQLSYNFKARRKRNQKRNYRKRNIFELKALAIREDKIYVYEIPNDIKKTYAEIYWDIEGIPEIKSYYLIGLLIIKDNETIKHQFWAENKENEIDIFYSFLKIVRNYNNYKLFHYGSYEVQYLKYMRQKVEILEHKTLIDELLGNSVNLLEYFSYNIYLPTYSNSLKEVGSYIGLKWSDIEVIGIKSIIFRKEWEFLKKTSLKERLLQYNYEDCINLFRVRQFITKIIENKNKKVELPFKVEYEKANEQNTTFAVLNGIFADPNFEIINNCSYFDYQTEKVQIRENVKAKRKRPNTLPRKSNGSTNQKIYIEVKKCIYCLRKSIGKISNEKTKKIIDIKFNKSGVKRWITKYLTYEYYCSNCKNSFIPREFSSIKEHYGHSLKSWVIYQHYVNQLSFEKIIKNIEELFKLYLTKASAHSFKEYFKTYYGETHKRLISKILNSPVIYVDETPFKLLSGEVYAWIFTNGQEVVSLFKPTRKGDFLKEMLKDFNGVLVSDFFSAYNSLECRQQKCLIHLIRDLNEDLLKNPFDAELKQITRKFTTLLKAIIITIDKKGFDKNYLIKYKNDVDHFFDFIESTSFYTETGLKYQERFRKNIDKLFTFIEFDNVSWNNTFAEHAIKIMAVHRNKNIKFFKESRMEDYLLIMSLYQTSEYKGFDFLKFLLSRETDIDKYC